MFPYQYGNEPMGTPGGLGMGIIPLAFDRQEVPEEIRAALEERQNEIHSEEDIRRLVYEMMLRR